MVGAQETPSSMSIVCCVKPKLLYELNNLIAWMTDQSLLYEIRILSGTQLDQQISDRNACVSYHDDVTTWKSFPYYSPFETDIVCLHFYGGSTGSV